MTTEAEATRADTIRWQVRGGVTEDKVPSSMFSKADLDFAFASAQDKEELAELERVGQARATARAEEIATSQRSVDQARALRTETEHVVNELKQEAELALFRKATAIARERLGMPPGR